MPDEILLIILSILPIKDAVATSSLSKRWKLLWCNLTHLNFDGSKAMDKMDKNQKLCDSERSKYIKLVHDVISSHTSPTVQEFRIRFDLDHNNKHDIDRWLQFAVEKNVEILELDLMKNGHQIRTLCYNYDFPSRLPYGSIGCLSKWRIPFVELLFLKNLVLKSVNVTEAMLLEFLKHSPHLESLCIHAAGYLIHVVVGGQRLKLKHLEIAYCRNVRSVYLYKFDLVSFSYKGRAIDFRVADLPKFKELDIGEGLGALENSAFDRISSCFSYIEVLSLDIYLPKQSLMLNFFPKLPKVKRLRLRIGAHLDTCLLVFASIANACPSLESCTIEPLWYSPSRSGMKSKHVAIPACPLAHLRLVEIIGYFGRSSDFQLVAYIVENVVALKKIVIDPRCQDRIESSTVHLRKEKAARSSAQRQLKSLIPPGVQLVIL